MSTEEPVATAAAAPAIARPVAHDSHAHLVFPNLLDTFRSLLSIIVIALFVLTFVVQPFRIPSESMERTLLVGDFLLVYKVVYGKPGPWRWLLPAGFTVTLLAAGHLARRRREPLAAPNSFMYHARAASPSTTDSWM